MYSFLCLLHVRSEPVYWAKRIPRVRDKYWWANIYINTEYPQARFNSVPSLSHAQQAQLRLLYSSIVYVQF